MIRKLRLVGLLLIAALSLACNTQPATCDELPLTSDTTEQLAAASTAVGFAPQLPCVYRNDLEVARIFDDSVGSAPRINFLVLRRGERRDLRDGERIFIFSQTRGEVPFHAIPRSTHNIAITATTVAGDSVTASGFAGPTAAEAGRGDTIAYLRWRTDGITHELAAILTHWFDELTALHTAAALIATR
jgi:hypothetical protein